MLIVTAPLWFKAPFKILRLFVREKLRDRVFTVSVPQLSLHIPRDSLPVRLGGSLEIDHTSWLLHCYKSMTNREDELLATTGQTAIEQQSQGADQQPQSERPEQQSTNVANGQAVATIGTNETQIQDASGHINELWTENPPSSASSGFSDDDSLAGTEGDPKTIEQIVDMVKILGRRGLIKEYAEIRSRAPDGTFTNAKLRNNLTKNRYTDVLCYDHSRVVLTIEDGDPTSDYINANFVDGYKQRNAYISTQGEF